MNATSGRQARRTVDFKLRNEDQQHSASRQERTGPPLLHTRSRGTPLLFGSCFCDDGGGDQGREKQLTYSEVETLRRQL